jgi:hypothetical protein
MERSIIILDPMRRPGRLASPLPASAWMDVHDGHFYVPHIVESCDLIVGVHFFNRCVKQMPAHQVNESSPFVTGKTETVLPEEVPFRNIRTAKESRPSSSQWLRRPSSSLVRRKTDTLFSGALRFKQLSPAPISNINEVGQVFQLRTNPMNFVTGTNPGEGIISETYRLNYTVACFGKTPF